MMTLIKFFVCCNGIPPRFAKDSRVHPSGVSSEGFCSKYDICQDESFLSLSCSRDGGMAIVMLSAQLMTPE
jgi:hypothetical protein